MSENRSDALKLLQNSPSLQCIGFQIELDARGVLAIHEASQIRYRLVRGGEYRIGLSLTEEMAACSLCNPPPITAKEMRPVSKVLLSPILVSETPILNRVTGQILGNANENVTFPSRVTKEEADLLADRLGARLLREAEWEVACRAGTRTLFPFGNKLPSEKRLSSWLQWDIRDPLSLPANRWGFVGLFFGEWCSDVFRQSYAEDALVEDGSWTVRGGGAFFWPWQGQEWVWCMSAMRMPSSALAPDERCCVRLAYDVTY